MLYRSLILTAILSASLAAEPKLESTKVQFPSGEQTVARFTLPPGFSATCFAHEPMITKPIAMDFDSKGRLWVLECHSYPHKQPQGAGKDRIKILEDTNGDGVADKVTVFAEGLNLATGMAVGNGGVYVGEPPELVFLKDTTGDGVADHREVLLDGWGYQDTHETLNSFIWGPDGWLYGCHGVFTHSRVGKPGSKPEERVRLNAGIWRFHPKTHAFELFAEGTSNPWGFDYDETGEGFLTCCVIPHLFHMIPGGRYARQAGQNFHPYNYGEIKWICEDLHYYGGNPHDANKDPRSLKHGGGHAHAGCLIYQGDSFPPEWRGKIFMNNIHGGRINVDRLKPNGSTYIGNYDGDFLVSNDPNFRVLSLKSGPDGSIYMLDWYDPQICHNLDANIWNRNYGRIYKVTYQGDNKRDAASANEGKPSAPPATIDLEGLPTAEVVGYLTHANSWYWRNALRILAERNDAASHELLRALVFADDVPVHRLRGLWGLASCSAVTAADAKRLFDDPQPTLRAWAVRAVSQQPDLPRQLKHDLSKLAGRDSDPRVVRELASLCQRLDPDKVRYAIAAQLSARIEFSEDPVLPFMFWLAEEPVFNSDKWWAIPYVVSDPAQKEQLTAELKDLLYTPNLYRDFLTPRRLRKLASGNANELEMAIALLATLKQRELFLAAANGVLEALRGRRLAAPPSWTQSEGLRRHFQGDAEVISRLNRIGIHFGDPATVTAMEAEAASAELPWPRRREAIQALALARLATSVPALLNLQAAEDSRVRTEALRALGSFDDPAIPNALLANWSTRNGAWKKETLLLMVSKKDWAAALLEAIATQRIAREELTEAEARKILAFSDAELSKRLETVWGKLRAQTPDSIRELLTKTTERLRDRPADRVAGRAVFVKNCQTCHKLFGEGHSVGPELTGANRRDPAYLLENILDPNRIVGKEYYSVTIEDQAGRLHTGILAEETSERVTLKGENDKLTTIARTEIEQMQTSEKSLMPEGLPTNMTEQEFGDLIAYLLEDPYLTRGRIAGPFKMALDYAGPIETAADPLRAEGVAWKPFSVGPLGQIDMGKLKVLAPPTDSTAYVHFEVVSPSTRTTILELAADEDVKVWVNGREVHRKTRAFQPQRVEIELQAGTNKLLFKVHNIYGPSWLWARLADPKRELEQLIPGGQ